MNHVIDAINEQEPTPDVCMGCNGHGDVGQMTQDGWSGEMCPFCGGSGKQ